MSELAVNPEETSAAASREVSDRAAQLRAGLLLCFGAAIAVPAALVEPSALPEVDPELARLLRAMALIKAPLAAGALGLVWWRLGWPLSTRAGLGYVVGATLTGAACVLIWKLVHIATAALLFHAGAVMLVLLGLSESRLRQGRARRAKTAPGRAARFERPA